MRSLKIETTSIPSKKIHGKKNIQSIKKGNSNQIYKNITVQNVPFIMDNNLTRINTISFALLDHTNKQVYTWYKKESYNLYKHDKYYIRLKDDGEFSITSSPFIMQLQNIYKLIDN